MRLFRPEALDFQRRRLLGDVMIVQPVRFAFISAVLASMVIAVIVFLWLGTYTEKKSVRGSLVPASGLVTVPATSVGVVDRLLVEQGATVRRGEPLLTIRRDVPDTAGLGSMELMDGQLAAQEAELRERIGLVRRQGDARARELQTRIEVAREELTHLGGILETNRRIATIAREEAERLGVVARSGGIAVRESILSERERLGAESAVFADQQRIAGVTGLIRQYEAQLALVPLDRDAEISAVRLQLSEIAAQRAELLQSNVQTLNAPVSGTVTAVRATLGRPALPGEALIDIRGEADPLVAELVIPTSVIGSITSGQRVRLVYDAFPFQRYGAYEGTVTRVSDSVYTAGQRIGSEDVVAASYKASVRLDAQSVSASSGRRVALQPGMELRAEIILEERRLIALFFRPLVEAMRG